MKKTVLVTHGGISNIFENFVFLPTIIFIKGTVRYEDMIKTNQNFYNNSPNNYYQIHGHRNIENIDIKVNDKCFNLCDNVEFGKCLRILTLDKNGFTPIKIKNTIFNQNKKNY